MSERTENCLFKSNAYIFEDYWREGTNQFYSMNNGQVLALGKNRNGILGFGHDDIVQEKTTLHELCFKSIIDLKTGFDHAIALTNDGKVFSWGFNDCGQIGNGKLDRFYHKPRLNKYLIHIKSISCGFNHSLVLTRNGEVYAWGSNNWGQIGSGSVKLNQPIPKKVMGLQNEKIIAISCGGYHSLALTETGFVFSWGCNEKGQTGTGRGEASKIPILIQVGNDTAENLVFMNLCAGLEHSFLLTEKGVIYSFGNNDFGQLRFRSEYQTAVHKKLLHSSKFKGLKSYLSRDILIALSNEDVFYVWGDCGADELTYSFDEGYKSFDQVYAKIFIFNENDNEIKVKTKVENKIKDFDKMSLISFGSYGIVFKAVHKGLNQDFAIKIVPFDEHLEKKTLKEIEILMKLKSKFIVSLKSSWIDYNNIRPSNLPNDDSVMEFFRRNNTRLLYMQMELCSRTLFDAIKVLNFELHREVNLAMNPLGYYISSELFKEILEGLEYIHSEKIIHRDLNGNNILISNGFDGRFIKIADFGLSVLHEYAEQSHTKGIGTLRFTAPEVLRSKNYDTKADIYSLGVLMQDLFNFDINT
jgi:hypothetical protein